VQWRRPAVPALDGPQAATAFSDAARRSDHLLYCDHVEGNGEELFRLVCEADLEGIVAKPKFSPYLAEHANWLKIRNRDYSQWVGREELFERERGSDPDLKLWNECAVACEVSNDLPA
jgi:hypothetical protein